MAGVRVDLFLAQCMEVFACRFHPHIKSVMDAGGREVLQKKLNEIGVTDREVTLLDAARQVGFIGPDPNVIDVEPVRVNRKRRRAGV